MGVTLKAVHLESWLVEAMFGNAKEHIPHVKCEMHTISHKLVGPRRCTWDLDVLVSLLPMRCIQGNKSWLIISTSSWYKIRRRILLRKLKSSVLFSHFSPWSLPLRSTRLQPSGILSSSGPSVHCPITNLWGSDSEVSRDCPWGRDQELSSGGLRWNTSVFGPSLEGQNHPVTRSGRSLLPRYKDFGGTCFKS